MRHSSFISKEVFEGFNTSNCEFASSKRYNVLFCDEGKIFIQNARDSSQFVHVQLPDKLVKDINQPTKNGFEKVYRFILPNKHLKNGFWVQIGWKIYMVYEDPNDPNNAKFKKWANLDFLK